MQIWPALVSLKKAILRAVSLSLGRFGQDVLAHGRRAGVEDLVEALRQAQVGHVVSAVDEGDVFRREHLGEELLERRRRGRRLAAGLDDYGVAARHRGRHHADSEEDGEVEGADDQRDAVRHLIDLGDCAGEAQESAEMALRTRPAAQAGEHFVDLDDDGADVAEVSFHPAAAEVFGQGVLELLLVGEDGGLQPLELLDAPADGQRLSAAEEPPLGCDDLTDLAFGVYAIHRS